MKNIFKLIGTVALAVGMTGCAVGYVDHDGYDDGYYESNRVYHPNDGRWHRSGRYDERDEYRHRKHRMREEYKRESEHREHHRRMEEHRRNRMERMEDHRQHKQRLENRREHHNINRNHGRRMM